MFTPKVAETKRRREEMGLSRQKLSLLAGLPKNAVYRIKLDQVGYTLPYPRPRPGRSPPLQG